MIVGIDAYSDPRIPNLRFARKDAEAVYKVLTNPAIGRFSPDNVITLLDGDATERKIRSALGTKLPRLTSKTSTVCIYYAGHGAPVIDVDAKRRSADNIEKYLVPHDAEADDLRSTAISMDSIQQYLLVARCQAGDLLPRHLLQRRRRRTFVRARPVSASGDLLGRTSGSPRR